jgi:hypothetical protein
MRDIQPALTEFGDADKAETIAKLMAKTEY